MSLNRRVIAAAMWLGLAGSIPAFGQFAPIASPTAAYTGSTTLIPITGSDGTAVPSITDGTQTIMFSSALSAATVPSGGWATWGAPPNTESSTPRVLTNFTTNTLTMTLSVPSHTFGFEIEPDSFGAFLITANFYNGSTLLGTVSRTVNGDAGALLAAGSDTTTITSVVITAASGANGFAVAELRYGSTILGASVPH